jgi:hypothetical protein
MNKLRAHGNNTYIVWYRVDDSDTVTVHAELFHHCETEYSRNFDLIIQICLSLSLVGVRHCILTFVALAWTSKHNLSNVNETNVSNTGRLTYVSCCTIS